MTTRTSVKSGLWSDPTVWDTGVPVDGDVALLNNNYVIEFDVDQSAWTIGIFIRMQGATIKLTRSSGIYCLKICDIMPGYGYGRIYGETGTNILDFGTSLDPIPYATKFTLTGVGDWSVVASGGTLKLTVFGSEPVYPFAELLHDENIGATTLHIDRNLTGSTWEDGDTIYIIEHSMNFTTYYDLDETYYEERVISSDGISPTTLTITSGLTVPFQLGSKIFLLKRHLKFIHTANSQYGMYRLSSDSLISGGEWYYSTDVSDPTSPIFSNFRGTIDGGIFYDSPTVFRGNVNSTINGGNFVHNKKVSLRANDDHITEGVFAGNYAVNQECFRTEITGGTFENNYYDNLYCQGIKATGTSIVWEYSLYSFAFGSNNLFNDLFVYYSKWDFVYRESGDIITGVEFGPLNSGSNIVKCSNIKIINCIGIYGLSECSGQMISQLWSPIGLGSPQANDYDNLESISPVSNNQYKIRILCTGGIASLDTTVYPSGLTESLRSTISLKGYVFWKRSIPVIPDSEAKIKVWLRKTGSMSILPKVCITNWMNNPILDPTSILQEFVMTDSTNTWESYIFTIANTLLYDEQYHIWFISQASEDTPPPTDIYGAYEILGGGGGSPLLYGTMVR